MKWGQYIRVHGEGTEESEEKLELCRVIKLIRELRNERTTVAVDSHSEEAHEETEEDLCCRFWRKNTRKPLRASKLR